MQPGADFASMSEQGDVVAPAFLGLEWWLGRVPCPASNKSLRCQEMRGETKCRLESRADRTGWMGDERLAYRNHH